MSKLKEWLRAALIRAAKSAAQAGILVIGSDAINIASLDWRAMLGYMAGAALLSLLMSTAGLPEVGDGASVRALHAADNG